MKLREWLPGRVPPRRARACISVVTPAHPATLAPSPLQHPTQGYGLHRAPVADPKTTFTLVDAARKPVSQLCPGQSYTLTVSQPQARHTLLTASVGSFARHIKTPLGGSGKACTNRVAYDNNTPGVSLASKVWVEKYTTPCALGERCASHARPGRDRAGMAPYCGGARGGGGCDPEGGRDEAAHPVAFRWRCRSTNDPDTMHARARRRCSRHVCHDWRGLDHRRLHAEPGDLPRRQGLPGRAQDL